ncbi:MAG: hypothetical protein V3S30_07480 [Thermoanaerobaculia bacterium]
MIPGGNGQYDVVVDGEVIASRQPSVLKRLLGGGWPDNETILTDIQRRQEARGTDS